MAKRLILFSLLALAPSYAQRLNSRAVTGPLNCIAASASGTAYTCTTSPSFTPAANDVVYFVADVANTGSATLAVNGASAATLKKQSTSSFVNLVANDLLAGSMVTLKFDGANWLLNGQSGNLPLHAATHQNGGTDEVATATPGANLIPKAGAGGTLASGWIPSTYTQTICSGTVALGTSAIASGTAATTITATCTGLASTDNIALDFNGSPLGVTGYVPSTSGTLTIVKWPSSNTINVSVVNNTTASITPGAITLNYHVYR